MPDSGRRIKRLLSEAHRIATARRHVVLDEEDIFAALVREYGTLVTEHLIDPHDEVLRVSAASDHEPGRSSELKFSDAVTVAWARARVIAQLTEAQAVGVHHFVAALCERNDSVLRARLGRIDEFVDQLARMSSGEVGRSIDVVLVRRSGEPAGE